MQLFFLTIKCCKRTVPVPENAIREYPTLIVRKCFCVGYDCLKINKVVKRCARRSINIASFVSHRPWDGVWIQAKMKASRFCCTAFLVGGPNLINHIRMLQFLPLCHKSALLNRLQLVKPLQLSFKTFLFVFFFRASDFSLVFHASQAFAHILLKKFSYGFVWLWGCVFKSVPILFDMILWSLKKSFTINHNRIIVEVMVAKAK